MIGEFNRFDRVNFLPLEIQKASFGSFHGSQFVSHVSQLRRFLPLSIGYVFPLGMFEVRSVSFVN